MRREHEKERIGAAASIVTRKVPPKVNLNFATEPESRTTRLLVENLYERIAPGRSGTDGLSDPS